MILKAAPPISQAQDPSQSYLLVAFEVSWWDNSLYFLIQLLLLEYLFIQNIILPARLPILQHVTYPNVQRYERRQY